MAGLENYERVYRGKSTKSWESENNLSVYHGREVIRPLDVPVMHPLAEDSPPAEDITVKRYIGATCGLASLITETLLVHPFVVLRRQCQVNPGSNKYHIVPVTLVPVIVRLHQTQGINTLWKGIGSVLLVKGMMLAIEDFLSKVTPWPKEITCNSSLKAFGQHVLLKCVSIGLTTPFYSASLVETVQSEIASESPGILDVFRDGAIRLVEVSNKGRLIPIYSLLPPTIACGVTKYLFTLTVHGVTNRIMQIRQKQSQESRNDDFDKICEASKSARAQFIGKFTQNFLEYVYQTVFVCYAKGAYSRDLLSEEVVLDIELQSVLISTFMAEVLFYPWETVIHRLHLQGTRTIIDNLDTGRSVTPLLTGYSGAIDCYDTILSTEGPLGLYKGFGALLLQFTMDVVIVRVMKWIVTELGKVLKPKPKSARKEPNWNYNEL